MKKKNLFYLGVCVLCFLKCSKDKISYTLPPATQEGKNTVGFTINGEVWVPFYECNFSGDRCGEISVTYIPPSANPNQFKFHITRERSGTESLLIVRSSVGATITSTGNKIDSIGMTFLNENNTGNDGYFVGPLPGSKLLITKIDNQNQIISGEFEFILREQNFTGNTITLKNGRFDFKFLACICSN